MPLINYSRKKTLLFARNLFIWFSFILTVLLATFSCNQNKPAKTEDLSDGFKVIFNNVNRLDDHKRADEAIHYLDSSFKLLDKPTVNDTFRFYAVHFSYYKIAKLNRHKEMLYADSLVNMAQKIKGKSYVSSFAEASFAKGDAYLDLKQYNNAYQYFYRGYFIGKNHLDNSVLAGYTYRMGMIMFRQSHFELAAKYFKESYRQSFAHNDDFKAFFLRQELLNNIGESYQHNGNIDSAALYFNKTLAYINQNNNRFKKQANLLEVARAVTYGDLGIIAYNQKQFTRATNLLNKSIEINLKKYNDNSNAELFEISLGRVYLDQHKDALFTKLMQDMSRQFDSVKNMEAETGWSKLMSDYYTYKKDYANALQYFRKYTVQNDSLVQQFIS